MLLYFFYVDDSSSRVYRINNILNIDTSLFTRFCKFRKFIFYSIYGNSNIRLLNQYQSNYEKLEIKLSKSDPKSTEYKSIKKQYEQYKKWIKDLNKELTTDLIHSKIDLVFFVKTWLASSAASFFCMVAICSLIVLWTIQKMDKRFK